MWCVNCNTDVATDVSAETGTVRCACCATPLTSAKGMSDAVRDAHSLLRKWSTSELIDRLTDDPLLTSVTQLPVQRKTAPDADSITSRTASQPDPELLRETELPPLSEATAPAAELTNRDDDGPETATASHRETDIAVVSQLPESDAALRKSDADPDVSDEPEPAAALPALDASDSDASTESEAEHASELKPTPIDSAEPVDGYHDADQPSVAFKSAEVESAEVNVANQEPADASDRAAEISISPAGESNRISDSTWRKNINHHDIRRRKIPRRDLSAAGDTDSEKGIAAALVAVGTADAAATTARPTIPLSSDAGNRDVKPKLRIDTPRPATETAEASAPTSSVKRRIDAGSNVDNVTETHGPRRRTQGRKRHYRVDAGHQQSDLEGPHYQIETPARSSVNVLTGQFLAYLGVLGLTIGTAIVIYGHFGGYAEYTPTGWLITTVAQMMLFLGVINLVSGGMEQTSDEMSHRIDSLSHQLLRIEEYADQLRGPKIPASRYAADAAESEDYAADREQVGA